MRGHGRSAPKFSTQHQRNNFIPVLRVGQSEEKCQSRTLYRFFLYVFPSNLLRSLKRRLRTHDSALRYITVASLDKRLCEGKKNTRTISGIARTFGTKDRYLLLCAILPDCNTLFSWICLITLWALRDELNFYLKSTHVIKILITEIAEREFRFAHAKSNYLKY